MKKPSFIALLIFVSGTLGLSGCLKDRLTHIVSGTYTVSGTCVMFAIRGDTSHTIFQDDTSYLNNVTVKIEKQGMENISVAIQALSLAASASLDHNLSSDGIYVFSGYGSVSWEGIELKFDKNDWDAIDINYHIQQGILGSTDYQLHGRKN